MTLYGDSLKPASFRDADSGLRPSYQKLADLLDRDDPAWPAIADVLTEMTAAGVEINAMVISIAVKLGTHRLAARDAGKPASSLSCYKLTLATSGSIVYYARRGPLIKIGTTLDPALRFRNLLPDEILAFEPGTVREEVRRHRQFAHLWQRGEYFTPAPELMEHAQFLRKLHGDPDPSWPTVTTVGARWRQASSVPLPEPSSGIKLSTVEAVEMLGIKANTLRGWQYRRRLPTAGYDYRGIQVFYLEHLLALRERGERRKTGGHAR